MALVAVRDSMHINIWVVEVFKLISEIQLLGVVARLDVARICLHCRLVFSPVYLHFLFSFDPDMTVRHTVWGMLIGGYFTWVSIYGINQTQVQRYLSVPEKKKAVT